LGSLANQGVPGLEIRERQLNGEPGVVVTRDGRVFSAILVAVADGRIRQVFVQINPERLRHVGASN
jgi:RNA polymerase sigma-70 factor (ECF subfamily)